MREGAMNKDKQEARMLPGSTWSPLQVKGPEIERQKEEIFYTSFAWVPGPLNQSITAGGITTQITKTLTTSRGLPVGLIMRLYLWHAPKQRPNAVCNTIWWLSEDKKNELPGGRTLMHRKQSLTRDDAIFSCSVWKMMMGTNGCHTAQNESLVRRKESSESSTTTSRPSDRRWTALESDQIVSMNCTFSRGRAFLTRVRLGFDDKDLQRKDRHAERTDEQ
jgi:hypothetical protein